MTTLEEIDDLKAELAALVEQEPSDYWPEWEKQRDIDGKLVELHRLISGLKS